MCQSYIESATALSDLDTNIYDADKLCCKKRYPEYFDTNM